MISHILNHNSTHLRYLRSAALSCGSAVLGSPPRRLLHCEALHCRRPLRAQPLRQLNWRLRGGCRAPRAGRAHHGSHQRVTLPVRMQGASLWVMQQLPSLKFSTLPQLRSTSSPCFHVNELSIYFLDCHHRC